MWATGGLKVFAGLIPLALVRGSVPRVPRWMLLAATWLAGAILLFYGLVNTTGLVIIELGWRDVPPDMGEQAVRWGAFFWQPLFALGGALFLAAAWQLQRRKRALALD